MKIIISPAKMMVDNKVKEVQLSIPFFEKEVKELITLLKALNTNEIMQIMKVNKEIAEKNKLRFEEFKFDEFGSPAIFTYNGIQYKNINLENFSDKDIEYLNSTVRIISGLYGVLKPLDSIYQYRLEMNTSFKSINRNNLYHYWDNKIYNYLIDENKNEIIINLASVEYSKLIEKFIDKNNFITCVFKSGETVDKLKISSTESKKMRGQMVNYIVKNRINNHNELKSFSYNDYKFCKQLSTENVYSFIKIIK